MNKEELLGKKISAISLGCDKNRVDLEHMLGKIREAGFVIVDDIDDAEIIIVNTCSFIAPAVKEAIDNVLLSVKKKEQKCEKVIVSGCLNERFLNETKKSIPEVDKFVKIKDNYEIVKIIYDLYDVEYDEKQRQETRVLTTNGYAYLKISDGCNNGCAYCTIPRIRGRYKSVPMEDLIKEAKILAQKNVKELIIVAQDITRYGEDLYGKSALIELLTKLSKIKEFKWIRLHYCYPEMVDDELLKFISENEKICKYIDIPLQHIDNTILYNMNRKIDEEKTRQLIEKIKAEYPSISIRSTFIVGFPGETRFMFKKLCNFIRQSKLNNVGFFKFFKEEKTKAYFMKHQIPEFIKNLRLKKIEKIQQEVADSINIARVGQVEEVFIDGFDEITGRYIARDEFNSPDVDFYIEIEDNGSIEVGNFYIAKLTDYINGIYKGEIQ